jgi:hypothetical protein
MKLTSIASISAVVAGLLGVGVGGYNLVTTGCPLGTCAAPATTTQVSTDADHACALGCGHESHTKDVVAAGAVSGEKKDAHGCCHSEKACSEEVVAAGAVSDKSASDKKDCDASACDKAEACCKKGEKKDGAPKDPA